jgi:hypothetical protein
MARKTASSNRSSLVQGVKTAGEACCTTHIIYVPKSFHVLRVNGRNRLAGASKSEQFPYPLLLLFFHVRHETPPWSETIRAGGGRDEVTKVSTQIISGRVRGAMTPDRWFAVIISSITFLLGALITWLVSRYHARSDKKRMPTFMMQWRRT